MASVSRLRSNLRPVLRPLLAALLVVGGTAVDAAEGVLVAAVVFVLVAPFEQLFRRHDQPVRRPALGTDVAYAAAQPLLAPVGIAVAVVVGVLSLAWLPGLLLRPFVLALPGWAQLAAAVALFDLAGYWAHRWSHEVPFLWRFHSVHHSTEHLDWVSGFRAHPVDGALLAPPFAFLLAAGFSPEVTGAVAVLQVLVGLFLHANVRWRLRPLQRLVATPEFHHWHHANEGPAWFTNYAALLPMWDQVFGTYRVPADERPRFYGVDAPVPRDIVGQLSWPLAGLPRPRWIVAHPLAAVARLARALRRGIRQVRASTFRPRHPVPVAF